MSTEGNEGPVPPSRPPNPQQTAASKRLQHTQAQVDEVVDIMRTNVEKVLERDQKLSELDDRADALQQGASQFEQQAGKLKENFGGKTMIAIMVSIGLIIIIIIADVGNHNWSNTSYYYSYYCLGILLRLLSFVASTPYVLTE